MSQRPEQGGIPIYQDETVRNVADAIEPLDIDAAAWYPSNSSAQKLWRCLEAMRDLESLLSESAAQKNASKRKRKLKIAITPLHSLITCLDDLCNDIQSTPETRSQLDDNQLKEVATIKREFAELLPHNHQSTITTVRNQLSSHIDKKLHPSQAQKLSDAIKPPEFGRWLHICLHLALDLTKLNIYAWSCEPPSKDYVRFMTNEPFIVTFKIEAGSPTELAALNIANGSPRNALSEIIDTLVKHSQWMFKNGQPRISSLKEGCKDNWNTFSHSRHFHQNN